MKNNKSESPMVTLARYSEIGFIIPASVFAGYILGLLADHFFHIHWAHLAGIIFGAIVGFVKMIQRALQASAESDSQDESPEEPKAKPQDDHHDRP